MTDPNAGAQHQHISSKSNRKRWSPYEYVQQERKLGITSEELVDTFIGFNHTLAERGNCHRRTGGSSIPLKCSCLAILVNDSDPEEHGLEAVSRLVYFGRLKKQEKQLKLIDWVRYAEADETRVNKTPYFLPFRLDVEVLGLEEAAETYSNLATHMIFQSTMMGLLGVGRDFWKTCQLCVETHQLPIHGLVGKVNVKRKRFEVGEEPELIDFFEGVRAQENWQYNCT
jgi:hypothetical protein